MLKISSDEEMIMRYFFKKSPNNLMHPLNYNDTFYPLK